MLDLSGERGNESPPKFLGLLLSRFPPGLGVGTWWHQEPPAEGRSHAPALTASEELGKTHLDEECVVWVK